MIKTKKIVAILLAASLTGVSLCACGGDLINTDTLVNAAIQGKSDEELLTEVVNKVANAGSGEAKKQETVYVKTDACGKVDSVVVSNWLKNTENTEKLEDYSDLTDIQNVKGHETYKAEGSKLTWETKGEDIYYQGTTDKELPVDVNISYTLDGKEITSEDLAGKTGHVVVTIDYENRSVNHVKINNNDETIYTPFAVVSAMALDEEKFANVSVTNGTVVSDGKRDIVVGMAFPGLIDSLNGSHVEDNELLDDIEAEIEIPDSVVVEADVNDYESGMILTLVTSDISRALGLDAIDLDSNASVNDMKASIEEFGDAGDELAKGTGELKDGATKLSSGTDELAAGTDKLYKGVVEYTSGVGKVAEGAAKLDKGAGELANGAGAIENGIGKVESGVNALGAGASSVEEGAKKVSDGAKALSESVGKLDAGAKQVSEGVDTLTGQMGTIATGVGNAAAAAGSISTGIDQVVAALSQTTDPSSIDTSNISVTGTVSGEQAAGAMLQYITYDSLTQAGLSDEEAQAVLSMVATVSSQVIPGIVDTATDATAKQVAANAAANSANQTKNSVLAAITTQGESGESLQSGAKALSQSLSSSYGTLTSEESQAKLKALSDGAKTLAGGTSQLATGAEQLAAGAESLYDGTTKLSGGAKELEGGLSELSKGAKTLKDGTTALKDGTGELAKGSGELASNSGALVDGSKALADGSAELVKGVRELLDGTIKLNDGMVKFNEEGVEKLTKVFDTDLDSMKERIRAIADVGRNYNTFSGCGEGEESSVKFIIESAEIKK